MPLTCFTKLLQCNSIFNIILHIKKWNVIIKIMKEKSISHIPEFVFSEEKQKQYELSFKMENNDHEMIELAEEGLDDFVEMIERNERRESK